MDQGFQLHSSDFTHHIFWFVNDTNIHRATVGNLPRRAVNGVVFVFNPRTGQLFMRVSHTSEWAAGQRPPGRLAKTRAAEEVAHLVRSMPLPERKKQIVMASEEMLEPLEARLHDVLKVAVKASKPLLPLPALLKIPFFDNFVRKSKEPHCVSPGTAFSRLYLILQALDANNKMAYMFKKPNQNHIWPSLTGDQWLALEFVLRGRMLFTLKSQHTTTNTSRSDDIVAPHLA
ncbi:hypothetical protein RJ639_031411 [Escallonia herrerae]|uniref:PRP8 domain-containing protein n=1 Tax=Escallonia herrerae TaxID=1293975 RepID=A0AA88XGJ5_9ASTE|nr:hypothetical protein RJ639_031411 [Escallonia herrerae]